jgi:hypothetical protein
MNGTASARRGTSSSGSRQLRRRGARPVEEHQRDWEDDGGIGSRADGPSTIERCASAPTCVASAHRAPASSSPVAAPSSVRPVFSQEDVVERRGRSTSGLGPSASWRG